jgi:hypothetical protein
VPGNRHGSKANWVSYSAQTRLVNVPTLWLGALRLQIEAAHAFVGVHNEHFLHQRRRGRGYHSCGVLGSASLKTSTRTPHFRFGTGLS